MIVSKIPKSYTLQTERFRLRLPKETDIPHIFSASRVKGFNDGLGWNPMDRIEDHLEPLRRSIIAWEEGRGYSFSIVDKANDQFLGRISIRKTDISNVWNIGFWTHPDYQKRGVMSNCVSKVIEFGFETLKATRIEAEHAHWNHSSRKVLERNGFQFVKIIEQGLIKNGEWVAEHLMAIDKTN